MPKAFVNDGGTVREASKIFVNDNMVIRQVTKMFALVGNTVQLVYQSFNFADVLDFLPFSITPIVAGTFHVGAQTPGTTGGTVVGTSPDGSNAATIVNDRFTPGEVALTESRYERPIGIGVIHWTPQEIFGGDAVHFQIGSNFDYLQPAAGACTNITLFDAAGIDITPNPLFGTSTFHAVGSGDRAEVTFSGSGIEITTVLTFTDSAGTVWEYHRDTDPTEVVPGSFGDTRYFGVRIAERAFKGTITGLGANYTIGNGPTNSFTPVMSSIDSLQSSTPFNGAGSPTGHWIWENPTTSQFQIRIGDVYPASQASLGAVTGVELFTASNTPHTLAVNTATVTGELLTSPGNAPQARQLTVTLTTANALDVVAIKFTDSSGVTWTYARSGANTLSGTGAYGLSVLREAKDVGDVIALRRIGSEQPEPDNWQFELRSAEATLVPALAGTYYVGARPEGINTGTVVGTSADGTHAITVTLVGTFPNVIATITALGANYTTTPVLRVELEAGNTVSIAVSNQVTNLSAIGVGSSIGSTLTNNSDNIGELWNVSLT